MASHDPGEGEGLFDAENGWDGMGQAGRIGAIVRGIWRCPAPHRGMRAMLLQGTTRSEAPPEKFVPTM